MSDSDHLKKQPGQDSDPVSELRKIAFMYHAVGDYEKAEEIMEAVEGFRNRQRRREDQQNRQDAA